MTRQFKPGDTVRPIATRTVKSVELHRLGDILLFEDGSWGAAMEFELATPSITHSDSCADMSTERFTGQITSDCHTLIDMNATPIGMVDIFGADYENDIATAKRLAACWNACQGMTDEDLASGVLSVDKLQKAATGIQRPDSHVWNAAANAVFCDVTGDQL
jgi:hypothetical protein